MNRKEAIEIIKNSNIHGARMNGKNLIIEAINELVKDITLSDLLGWEEGVEYKYEYSTYKLIGRKLYHRYGNANNWLWEETNYGIDYIIELQQATKVEE